MVLHGTLLTSNATELNSEPKIFIDNSKLASDEPNAFRKGITLTITNNNSSFPIGYGIVLTVFLGNGRGSQINIGPQNKPKYRAVNNGKWDNWSLFA